MSFTNGDEKRKETELDTPGSSATVASPTFMVQGVVPLPNPLRLKEGDAKDNCRRWKQLRQSYEVVSGLETQQRDYRFPNFVTCVGSETLDLYDAIRFEPEQNRKDIDTILKVLEDHVMGFVNATYILRMNGFRLANVTNSQESRSTI